MSISRSNSAAGGAFGNAMGTWLRQRLITRARLLHVVSIVGGLLIWELIASNYSHFILPSPSSVLVRLLDPTYAMQLGAALGASLQPMFVGFGLALAIAIDRKSTRLNSSH